MGSSLCEGVDDMKMISTGDGDIGAARITQEVSLTCSVAVVISFSNRSHLLFLSSVITET